ncbi:Glycosyl transferase family 2 [Agromyces sp. CF514]|nr:methyltransferase domain-containing protein [Agromyces sp. CF514]SFR85403.1 Glycosyl transferase family 2 [Agromyces sp. CF514]
MSRARYDTSFGVNTVHANVLRLVGRYADPSRPGLVLDLAAGYGAIAAELDREGIGYVGVDIESRSVETLRDQGVEAHTVDLSADDVLDSLRRILGSRRVAAITMLDGLEHLSPPHGMLDVIAELAREHNAIVVLSVPNVTHHDLGVKLAFGRWDYTPTGLLDETHVKFFSEAELTASLEAAGLHRVARDDFVLYRSDQHFPSDHPALSASTSLGKFLRRRRDAAEPNGSVNQFVWACVPGPVVERQAPAPEVPAPFVSVIVRTQGRRERELGEALTCLASQTSADFEVLIVAHDVNEGQRAIIDRVVDECPSDLRSRCRVIPVDGGNRARPLNVGFGAAVGEYVVVLDDDDLVFAHWIEVFGGLRRKHDGKLLRSRASVQESERLAVRDAPGTRGVGTHQTPHEREFSFVTHLYANQTPFMTVAFPRGVFHDLGERFDETLTTTEDWDYLLRAASLLGVADSPEITAVYRRWPREDSSATEHDADEWRLNMFEVFRKLDSQPVLLPAGETRAIRHLAQRPVAAAAIDRSDPFEPSREDLVRALAILESNSWRITALGRRFMTAVRRGAPVTATQLAMMNSDELRGAVQSLEGSRSWRYARVFRRGRR